MNEPMKRVIAVAIESYMHAPRVLSASKVVGSWPRFFQIRIARRSPNRCRNRAG